MVLSFIKNTFLFFLILINSCGTDPVKKENTALADKKQETPTETKEKLAEIIVGANRTAVYLPFLENKKVGIVGNQSSVIFKDKNHKTYTHLVDSLVALNVNVIKVYAPEHGFRGTADAGEVIKDGKDVKTGLPIISLYGSNKKPTPQQLENIDILIFDLQDVGARFYTYISSLHYVMEAAAANNIPMLILDRPNPNGHYIDGPILEPQHKSFVGMHPIPVVHGLTMGEYAKMINGEKWLKNGIQAEITVIEMENYDHEKEYNLPIKPSPNLPSAKAVNLYPSLCFFEGTNVNAGRGTSKQFQVFGSPFLDSEKYEFSYVPKPNEGSKHPKHEGKICYGKDLSNTEKLSELNLDWLIEAYNNTSNKDDFFTDFFTTLAGTEKLQQQIGAGMTEDEIRETWESGLKDFRKMRERYLMY
ncbi:MAG TPA: DUF1343 domain-containing protein [Salinimicrobium sp.]|nr:DUF1343 domain-containing protein [Salinimicrobium sp.]